MRYDGLQAEQISPWRYVLELDQSRRITAGSEAALCDAIGRGADLCLSMASIHNEHIDPDSDNAELIRELLRIPVTYLLENRWSAGVMSDRVPISPPDGFGPRMSMSFFMFNQDARQAIARPYLDGLPTDQPIGPEPNRVHDSMPKYHGFDSHDGDSNAPSRNFIYDFEYYRFGVHDRWEQVLQHDADGAVISGSVKALTKAVYENGCDVKVGISNICADLAADPDHAMHHELFVELGSCYHYTDSQMLLGPSRVVVRVKPAIPLAYQSRAWDFGWLMPRTDGFVACWLCDPYTLRFRKMQGRYAIRWFVKHNRREIT